MALKESLGTLSVTLLSMVRTRLELASLEFAEQRSRALGLLVLAFAALVLLLLGFLVFSVAVAMYFWPTDHRYLALLVLAGCYVLAGLIAFLRLRSVLIQSPPPFAATLEELERDIAMLDRWRDTDRSSRAPDRSRYE